MNVKEIMDRAAEMIRSLRARVEPLEAENAMLKGELEDVRMAAPNLEAAMTEATFPGASQH